MMARSGYLAFSLLLVAALGAGPAGADVYVWLDAAGKMNVSNLAPPDDARVKSVIHSVPRTAAQEEAARDAARRAEIQALNDRVARLQEDLEQQRREAAWTPATYAPPPVVYAPPPYTWAPPAQYVEDTTAPNYGCDYPWNSCGLGFGGWPFAAIVVNDGRHSQRPGHGVRPKGPGMGGRPAPAPRWVGPFRPQFGAMRRG